MSPKAALTITRVHNLADRLCKVFNFVVRYQLVCVIEIGELDSHYPPPPQKRATEETPALSPQKYPGLSAEKRFPAALGLPVGYFGREVHGCLMHDRHALTYRLHEADCLDVSAPPAAHLELV